MDVLVVGAGAMGRWMGRVLDADAPGEVSLFFADQHTDAAFEAADELDGTMVALDTVETFDAVCIAVPIPYVSGTIPDFAPKADRAMFDVTGTMATPIEAMAEHAPECERASFHPLFAPANEPGNVPVVVDEAGPVVETVRAALEARGNDCFETTAETHDGAMETVQARTHAAVLAYALAAEPVDDRFHTPISSELTALAEQVTDGEARVYSDIQTAFEGADDIAAAARKLADADPEAFEALYDEAGR